MNANSIATHAARINRTATERRSVRSRARTAATTNPIVIKMGDIPGPPGCNRKMSIIEISGSVSAAEFKPGSKKNCTGSRASVKLHGTSAANDAPNAIAALITVSFVRRIKTMARIVQTNRIIQRDGANARSRARSSAVPAARRFVDPGVKRRTPDRNVKGKRNAAKLVPNRPCASAPVMAGSNA